ncbi:MAG: hypothetical protein A3D67_02160 [Candidatus Lloydbacteria bacterium RIFCSPHIGHO2_02_FULL_51_22]|uniref:DNA primase n=3 Tax=Candidatus Lloydiibacteriota TaxID=1817910 RepID=A0A1G2DG21_9BACT|nr:MAG: hypothetical protein A3D67_02160 [Candidatus Lloydbacteria bacterium RIFCSPHIGHO2_02_FULL_51_22]OGZ14545.1 MAG: hypothetical protein A3J08_02465 [Candidatus Lloydbacteria bacterium RIFCSPLOWO2_02_FULL_51_11]OGZ17150.1 MAG: hypothetical protein A3G11_00745 [Candidatus Lloydbacteria bacterium RIFCSPLOWO2_12_FULL_51_9]
MSSSVEQIKDRLNIADVIGAYITLERAGKNFRARCPFHNERTPSFFVSPERGTFHCFGCSKGGDIFEFTKEFEGVDFYGALKLLAVKAGVELERTDPRLRDEREYLFGILDEAAAFYARTLLASPSAREYLKKRGLSEESIRMWRLGYAPSSWQTLFSFFSEKKVSPEMLVKAGLVIRADSGRYYDRFRGRVMFPIADSTGRVVAFSGRFFQPEADLSPGADPARKAAPADRPSSAMASAGKPSSAMASAGRHEAKYINSPETKLYDKSRALYGFDKAKQYIREKGACVVVEGQMDAVVAHQVGIRNTVATSGTALTVEHVHYIRRFTEKVVFAFDADAAGIAATERALKIALTEGMDVSLAHLPGGSDPAELGVSAPQELIKRIERSKHAVDFFLTVCEEKITDPRRLKIEAGKKVLPIIAHIKNRIEQAHFITETSRRIGVGEEVLWEELRRIPNVSTARVAEEKKATIPPPRARKDVIAQKITGILLQNARKNDDTPTTLFLKNAEKEFENLIGMSPREYAEALPASVRERLVFDALRTEGAHTSLEHDIKELLENLKKTVVRTKLTQRTMDLARAEKAGDETQAREISEEIRTLTKSAFL